MQSSIRFVALASLALLFPSNVSSFGIESLPSIQTAVSHLPHVTLPHVHLLSTYKQTLVSHPLPTKLMTGATLAVCGDAIAQSKDKTADYDTRRASSFAVFDMAYRALQHFSFPIIVGVCHGQFLGQVDPNHMLDASQWAAMEQTLASQLGIVPFMYYPAFFALTGAVQGLTASGAVSRAKENFLPLMKRNLLFWLPVQFVQFGYIQEDLQIPFLSVCGLAWTFILSVSAGSTKNYSSQKEAENTAILQLQDNDDSSSVISGRTANATSC